jgi:hypothetical protein
VEFVKIILKPIWNFRASTAHRNEIGEKWSDFLCFYLYSDWSWTVTCTMLQKILQDCMWKFIDWRNLYWLQYRLLSSSLCNFLHSPVNPSLLGSNILHNNLFSNTLSLCSINIIDQVLQPYKTTRKIILLYIRNSVALFCEWTMPTERPPPVGEYSANFCGLRGVTWSAQRITRPLISHVNIS